MEEEEAVWQTAPTDVQLLPLAPRVAPRMGKLSPNSMGTGCFYHHFEHDSRRSMTVNDKMMFIFSLGFLNLKSLS